MPQFFNFRLLGRGSQLSLTFRLAALFFLAFVLFFRCAESVGAFVCLMCGVGSRGGITQVKVAFMGNVKRTLVRNVKGPVRKNDILALLESEREARRLR